MPAKETVRFRSPRPKGRFGDPEGPELPWRPVPGCTVVPRTADDYEQRGQIVITGFMIRTPPFTSVSNADDVEVRGDVYQVDGDVGDFGRKGKILYVTGVD